jgi:hypothetical protein
VNLQRGVSKLWTATQPRLQLGQHGLCLSSSHASTAPGSTGAPSQLHSSTIRSRISGVTFAQIRGSTTPVA